MPWRASDRRLLRYGRLARAHLIGLVVVTVAVAGLVILQAQVLGGHGGPSPWSAGAAGSGCATGAVAVVGAGGRRVAVSVWMVR
jgi:hypothetical protein